jgi:hypothetical protein
MSNKSENLSNVLNLRLTAGYVFLKKHNINLNLALVHSKGQTKTQLQYSVNLAYGYVFNATLSRKEKKLTMDANF